jgi:hypothetical protein
MRKRLNRVEPPVAPNPFSLPDPHRFRVRWVEDGCDATIERIKYWHQSVTGALKLRKSCPIFESTGAFDKPKFEKRKKYVFRTLRWYTARATTAALRRDIVSELIRLYYEVTDETAYITHQVQNVATQTDEQEDESEEEDVWMCGECNFEGTHAEVLVHDATCGVGGAGGAQQID